jgi:outer membrane protein assembly factor BamD (BamD/ComL family)
VPRAAADGPARGLAPDGLRDQAEVLDGARALLAAGDGRGALGRVAEYDRRFPAGPLHEEALLLRIEALTRLGERGPAAALAHRFLETYPASVHGERVAALVQENSSQKPVRGP